MNSNNINDLLSLRAVDLQGSDLVELAMFALSRVGAAAPTVPSVQAVGVSALADALSCSPAQIYLMRRDGALDAAVISHVGRHIVFDVDRARTAANQWKENKKKPAAEQAS